ncbi:MAG: tRNA (adenosine(37)-N6)-threonylcarbamoyltransferase complex transferase subunit TsaD [Candidatus Omnitrophota bacterium]
MVTIGIETSCDETAVAVVEDGKVLSSEISSSVHLHSRYGGVVPEIASRYHVEYIFPVFKKALKDAGKSIKEVDLVTVTREPGLPGSLLVGTAFAKAVSFAAGVPLIGVNHLYAHVLSCFINNRKKCEVEGVFPFVGSVVSGGHTNIYWCESLDNFELIGRTKDDAVGEAFDKVAKILELGYPGGPVVEKRATRFSGQKAIPFPRALLNDKTDLDFSFSGIKTAVMYYWRSSSKTEQEKNKICFSFQQAAVDVIEEKIFRAIKIKKASVLAVGGGVVNNKLLRQRLINRSKKEKIELYLPQINYCADNAAMVAVLGEGLFAFGGKSRFLIKV